MPESRLQRTREAYGESVAKVAAALAVHMALAREVVEARRAEMLVEQETCKAAEAQYANACNHVLQLERALEMFIKGERYDVETDTMVTVTPDEIMQRFSL